MQYHYVYRRGKYNIELSLQVSFSDAGDISPILKLWVEVIKHMLRRTGYWMWFNLEIIGVSFKNWTLFYIRRAYGMKVIIHLNEHKSFPISKLCWTNIFKYLLWIYNCYATTEWVFIEIKISIALLPRVRKNIYTYVMWVTYVYMYIYIHMCVNMYLTCVYIHVYNNWIRCRKRDNK